MPTPSKPYSKLLGLARVLGWSAALLGAIIPLVALRAQEPNIGTEPPASFGGRDIFTEYHLPPFKNQPSDRLWQQSHTLQVLDRAQALGLKPESATEAWREADGTYAEAARVAHAPSANRATPFSGTRASELNALLARAGTRAVLVTSKEIEVDAPIRLDKPHVSLDLGRAELHAAGGSPYLIRIEGTEDVRLSGGLLTGVGWGVLVAHARQVAVLNMRMVGLSGGGLVITGSQGITVWGNAMQELHAAPVMLHGSSRHVTIAENEITGNLSSSNWHAGVVITDRNADVVADPASLLNPDNYGVKEQPMPTRRDIPEDNVVAYNHIGGNRASGIYSDGGARNVIVSNRIEGNSKEGLCLDNGSTANVVAYNLVQANGKRWGGTDGDLQRDFILSFGRLPDGSSPAKVPGISLDNAAYNQVLFNQVNRNYGGGVKMVRTSEYNVVGLNTLTDNNEGQNPRFHFFAVELGSARADSHVIDLDFVPSRGNEIFSNMIRGNHYAGIFFAEGSDSNTVVDNTIFGATAWAMESVTRMSNLTLNNLTNLKLRNISSGLDPSLLSLGAGQFDQP